MKYLLLPLLLFTLSFSFVNADHNGLRNEHPDHNTTDPAGTSGGFDYTLQNPLSGSGVNSIEGLLTAILNVLLVIAVPIIVFFIIFAGFNYVTARGNPEKVKTATRSLTYAIIGGVLILGSVALSEIIKSVVESFRS